MTRVVFWLAAALCLLSRAAFAQAPPTPAEAPPLPVVPQTTPPSTGPGVSPVTPGINLDPPIGLAAPAPVVETPIPADEQNYVVFEGPNPANVLRVDADGRYIVENDVHLRYRGYRIRADRVTLDDPRQTVMLEGHVVVDTGQQTFQLDTAQINLRTRDFTSRTGNTVVPTPLVAPTLVQPLRLSGETVSREGRTIEATEGVLTTCDYLDPHYRVTFRQATILPGRRIVLRDAAIYIGRRRIAQLRYLAIPLTDRQIRYNYLPQVGRTNEEGYFVKSAFGILLGETLPGLLRIDLMQKKGVGLGVDQAYRFGAGAAGTLVLYSLRDQNRGVNNLSGRLSHQQKLGDWNAALNSDFQQNSYQALTTDSQTQRSVLTLTRTAGATNTSLSYSLASSDYGFGATKNNAYTLTQSERFGATGNVTLRLNGSQFSTPGFGGTAGTSRRDQTGDLDARTRLGIWDVTLAANKNFTGSGSGSGGFFGGTERLPEITLATDTSRFARGWLQKLRLGITTGYGRFTESALTTDTEPPTTNRALLALDANPTPFTLTRGLSLNLGGNLRQTFYTSDAAQYVLTGRSQLTQRLGGTSSLNFTYGYLRPYGAPPVGFRLDQTGSFNNVGANLAVVGPRVKLTLLTGYDIQRARSDPSAFFGGRNPWQNLAMQLAFRPSAALQTRFTGSYDINSGRLRDLSNRLRVRAPGGFALDTGVRYDPATGRFPQITGALETPLFAGAYNLSALAGYNGFTRRFEYRNFALTRSWHDYELTLTFVDQPYGFRTEKGFNLLFRLKAFPVYQQPTGGAYGTALDTGVGEVF